MFYILLLYVHSCFAIILIGKRERELAALLSLSSWCLVIVVLAIPLNAMGLSAVCDTHLLFLGVIHANSDGFGESAHLLGLV